MSVHEAILTEALRAPSAHNAQPWRLVPGPDGRYELTARYLVGADGGHSLVRKLSGIGFLGVTDTGFVSRTGQVAIHPPAAVPGTAPASGPHALPICKTHMRKTVARVSRATWARVRTWRDSWHAIRSSASAPSASGPC